MRLAWLIAALWLAGLSARPTSAADPPANSSTPSGERVAAWIADLDAASYATREAATKHLIELGEAGIAPLSAVDDSASLEQVQRTVLILATLAADANTATADAATEALRRLAGAADSRLAPERGQSNFSPAVRRT